MARIQKKSDPLTEDREWLRGFKDGDPSALHRLYAVYVKDIVEFLKRGFSFGASDRQLNFRGFKEPWQLENAVQEVFIRAFSEPARQGFDGIRPYRNYLFRIAKNTVIDAFRQKKSDALNVEEICALEEQEISEHQKTADPEQDLADKQLMAQVAAFVGGLEQEARSLFEVRFVQGASVEDSARILKWSEYKVKRGEAKIKKRFFLQLKENGYFEGYRYENASVRSFISVVMASTLRMGI